MLEHNPWARYGLTVIGYFHDPTVARRIQLSEFVLILSTHANKEIDLTQPLNALFVLFNFVKFPPYTHLFWCSKVLELTPSSSGSIYLVKQIAKLQED